MNDVIKALLPTIANALIPGAGVVVGIAENFLAQKLGIPKDEVQQTIAGMKPEDLIKMKELDNELAEHLAENGIKLDLAQIDTNTEEAKSESVFVAGWRPAVGWVGACSLAYAAIFEPLLRFAAQVVFSYGGQFPVIDTSLTLQVLLGILGLGYLRTVDKKNQSTGIGGS